MAKDKFVIEEETCSWDTLKTHKKQTSQLILMDFCTLETWEGWTRMECSTLLAE